jgi:hypothetical protein
MVGDHLRYVEAPIVINVAGALGGIAPPDVEIDFYEFAAERVRQLTARVPDGLPCTTYARCGKHSQSTLLVLARARRVTAGFRRWPDRKAPVPCSPLKAGRLV